MGCDTGAGSLDVAGRDRWWVEACLPWLPLTGTLPVGGEEHLRGTDGGGTET